MVGINDYCESPLNGCINDVKLMYKVLKSIYKFEKFKVLTDQEATKKNIIKGLQWLIRDVKPGDTILFHFSGHGSQVPVNDRTASSEIDGLDEIICNVDLDWDDPIRDDDLGDMVNSIPEGVLSTVILDCCHSGTGLRNPLPNGIKNRHLSPPPSMMLESGIFDLDDDLSYLTSRKSRDPRMKSEPFLVNVMSETLLISGCEDRQYSADGIFGGRYHGALTFYLAQTLKEFNWNISYQDLVIEVNKKMDENGLDQNPQLEGRSDLFSTKFLGGI